MEPLLYVLAIMGCGDDSGACRQARVEPAQYTSIMACQQAMPQALQRNTDLEYPVITATCQRATPQMVDGAASMPRTRG